MDKNIIIIGMTGAGKSTVGKKLAEKLNVSFIDTDCLIIEKTGLSPRDIVQINGKEAFALIQEESIFDINLRDGVISTGGSVVEYESLMSHLKDIGIIVYLQVEFDVLEGRLDKSRPLAKSSVNSFYDLYTKREPLYKKYADITIECADMTVDNIANEIREKVPNSQKEGY